jgi:hypothetical protein
MNPEEIKILQERLSYGGHVGEVARELLEKAGSYTSMEARGPNGEWITGTAGTTQGDAPAQTPTTKPAKKPRATKPKSSAFKSRSRRKKKA